MRATWALILTLLSAGLARAQTFDITTPPAPIQFPNWREIDENDDGTEYLETFPSAVTTPYPANNLVPLRVFVPSTKAPAPAVLIFHYWGATDIQIERTLAGELNRRGIVAAVMTLPFHMARAPAGVRSGDLALQPDPAKLMESMRQAVLDARRSLDFLATRSEVRMDKVGICGTSLGAVVTALVAAIDPRITEAGFLLGGVDIAHIIWSSSRVVGPREAMRRHGMTEDKLRALLAPIEPATYLKVHRPLSSFVIGGEFDTVVPRRSTEELIDALATKNVLWINTGHYGGVFVQRRLLREMSNYFNTEMKGQPFVPPKSLYAPTVRLGFTVDTASGLDIAIGVDLLKFDRRGNTFSSLFVTPRGPEVFIGERLGYGLSIGLTGTTHGIGAGFLWSTVL